MEKDFDKVFRDHIEGQTVNTAVSFPPYGDWNIPSDERYYGNGLVFSNGYMILYHGGGCSGEDCNTTFIVDDNGKLVARNDW